jgi:hypothetical protein
MATMYFMPAIFQSLACFCLPMRYCLPMQCMNILLCGTLASAHQVTVVCIQHMLCAVYCVLCAV